jgi:hypothetical protein
MIDILYPMCPNSLLFHSYVWINWVHWSMNKIGAAQKGCTFMQRRLDGCETLSALSLHAAAAAAAKQQHGRTDMKNCNQAADRRLHLPQPRSAKKEAQRSVGLD